ncbi:MAG: CapA family protein [Clostridiales bacterium]|nr:CapA family protein [Clostridiales bacterium]
MNKITISFTGDIMCAPGTTELCTDNSGNRDYSPAFEKITAELNADLLVGNLETPIAGEELKFTQERYCFNSPNEFAEMLKQRGFDLVCLANNHCMDRGEEGITRTLDNLDKIGLAHTGIYRPDDTHEPCVLEANGIRVAIVNYTYGTNAFSHHLFMTDDRQVNLFQPEETLPGAIDLLIHLDESDERIAAAMKKLYDPQNPDYVKYVKPKLDRLRADIDAAKAVSDYVIVVMHSGGQYNRKPDAYTRMLTKLLRDIGADCIIGHHPHVIHGYENEGGIPVFYSLGNLYCRPSMCRDITGAKFSAIPVLTLEKTDNEVKLTDCVFSIIATVEPENAPPYCINSYELYNISLTDELKQTILNQAAKFGNRDYTTVNQYYKIN